MRITGILAERLYHLRQYLPHVWGIGTGVGGHVGCRQVVPDSNIVNTTLGHQAHFLTH